MCTSGHDEATGNFFPRPTGNNAQPLKDPVSLAEVDQARITLVVDNSIDMLLSNTEVTERYRLGPTPFDGRRLPVAEHGFSVWIEAQKGDQKGVILFDTGVSRHGLLNNLDALELDPRNLQAIVLSHGHPDHALGFPGLIERLGTRSLPLVLHPDAFLDRKLVLPNGMEIALPPPGKQDFLRENIELRLEPGPSALVEGMILISGEVARTTDFEKGFPIHYARRGDSWAPDPLILDDQCAILNVRGKGLIIVTGCGHSGVINVIRNAQRLTGVSQIYAVLGGFHLSGRAFEKIIPQTVQELKNIAPRFLMPGHCTGWVATHKIAAAMPEAFIANSAGTTLIL